LEAGLDQGLARVRKEDIVVREPVPNGVVGAHDVEQRREDGHDDGGIGALDHQVGPPVASRAQVGFLLSE